ncbi:MAG: RagB/SusD family nutrient uptake outer membrane protein [Chitinophaga sp.]|uniref:RagB/SusD family nutrient uptake outer membrane protein n=1 Tax=Chitinophaga sp. TaxID=1869181 RepID=UPI001B05AA4D|nr:RagB/SusD family nutrient uptake outer membrane protein [Chitinophaga sp.]MBO9730903.1 RagB/SusD family nutrient uptake outer membrane protein [Chitinophaga sp.]
MKENILTRVLLLILVMACPSCAKFLDVVPDNVATLDNAFTTRIEAKKYLFTCYSYMPKNGDIGDDPAMVGGDELWRFATETGFFSMAQGYQNVVTPLGDRWGYYFRAIRDCNIFLENIGKVPDLLEPERKRWIAEVQFLKGYYNFYLVMMYGPIPLMKTNLPVNADGAAVDIARAPVDSCFNYILELINGATGQLPASITDPTTELGRITQPIALSLKAKVMVYAASPLFNGNADEAGLKNRDGTPLFNPAYSRVKWDSAVAACKAAIVACQQAGLKLYKYHPDFQQYQLSDTITTQLSIRNSFCERWNSGIIWANTQTNSTGFQQMITTFIDPNSRDFAFHGLLSPPLHMAELFYTNNGVPISEDKTWDYANRYALKVAGTADELYVRKDYTSAYLNFNREPRFYADLGFDGGVWYGQGRYDDKNFLDLFYLEAKYRQRCGFGKPGFGSITGYYLKKAVHFQNVIGTSGDYSVTYYPWPIMRLSALYLMYAEALNEAGGPGAEVYNYVNQVRDQAGLKSVESSWTTYSNNPGKYTTQKGMRDIIHQETLIELAFEGQRFWDLRRWKEAQTVLNRPVKGWDLIQETAEAYYRPKVIFSQSFGLKNYFWPISENSLSIDRGLVQNLGW